MDYRSVEWHTNSDGDVTEIAVEYNQTLWQWLTRQPATTRRWRTRTKNNWWRVLKDEDGETIEASVVDRKEFKEILAAMDYIWREKYLRDLEDRCRKILQGE